MENFTRSQYDAVIDLCRQIKIAYEGEVTFHGHCEVSDKTCPVFLYKEVLGLSEEGFMVEAPNPAPQPTPELMRDDLPVLKLFARSAAVKLLQTSLNQKGQQLVVE